MCTSLQLQQIIYICNYKSYVLLYKYIYRDFGVKFFINKLTSLHQRGNTLAENHIIKINEHVLMVRIISF